MKALLAGSEAGGDKRCGEQKASSAFITVMRPGDDPKKPHLNLVISGIGKGGNNAVNVLEDRYRKWEISHKSKSHN